MITCNPDLAHNTQWQYAPMLTVISGFTYVLNSRRILLILICVVIVVRHKLFCIMFVITLYGGVSQLFLLFIPIHYILFLHVLQFKINLRFWKQYDLVHISACSSEGFFYIFSSKCDSYPFLLWGVNIFSPHINNHWSFWCIFLATLYFHSLSMSWNILPC